MRTVWTKSLLSAFAAAALVVGASAVDAQAASHHHHSVPLFSAQSLAGAPAANTGSNYFGGPSASPAISDSAPAETASTARGAPLASAEESCLVRTPIWSQGHVVGHRFVNAC
jgi:hypothetical protein